MVIVPFPSDSVVTKCAVWNCHPLPGQPAWCAVCTASPTLVNRPPELQTPSTVVRLPTAYVTWMSKCRSCGGEAAAGRAKLLRSRIKREGQADAVQFGLASGDLNRHGLFLLWNREKLADGPTPSLSISLTLPQEGPQKVHKAAAIHECLRRHECTNGQTRAASICAFVWLHSWTAVPPLQTPSRLANSSDRCKVAQAAVWPSHRRAPSPPRQIPSALPYAPTSSWNAYNAAPSSTIMPRSPSSILPHSTRPLSSFRPCNHFASSRCRRLRNMSTLLSEPIVR